MNADMILLLIAMKMYGRPIQGSTVSEFYERAKSCYSFLETRNVFSLKTLQALLLIALYEIANAIYPAAYITVGHCARLGHTLGIHDRKNASQMLPMITLWTVAEETRRVWWGVIILDRYVNIGTGNLPFACEDPSPADLLPADESCWERGDPTLIQSLAVSASISTPVSPFSRTCQASNLLSLIIHHINKKHADAHFHYQQAIKLHHIIYAFTTAITHELRELAGSSLDFRLQVPLFTSMAISYSAQLALYDMYTCADADDMGGVGIPEQLEMQSISLINIKEVCIAIHDFGNKIARAVHEEGLSRMSPLLSGCLYEAAKNCNWYFRETRNDELRQMLLDLSNVLKLLGKKWGVANEYINILEEIDEEGIMAVT